MALSVEYWFERQIRPRYADSSDEKAFLISNIQEWINTLNIQDSMARWRTSAAGCASDRNRIRQTPHGGDGELRRRMPAKAASKRQQKQQ